MNGHDAEQWRADMRSMTSEYIEIDNAIKAASKEMLPLRKRKKALQQDILTGMVGAGVDACNISGTADRLVVKNHKKKRALKVEDYHDRLLRFFEGDRDKVQGCLKVLFEPVYLEDVVLRRVKKRQSRKSKKEQHAQEMEEEAAAMDEEGEGGEEEEEGED
eukprot:jgi/Mesvir1/17051/Mv16580-RA.1